MPSNPSPALVVGRSDRLLCACGHARQRGPGHLAPGTSEWQAAHEGVDVLNTTSPSAIGLLSPSTGAVPGGVPLTRLPPRPGGIAPIGADARAGDQNRPRRPALVVHLADPVEERHQVGDLDVGHVLLGHEPPVALLVVELRRILQVGLQVSGAPVLRDLGQVGRVVGPFAEQVWQLMQLFLCQTSLPCVTAGVMFCAFVSFGNCRWLSIVSPRKAKAATTVEPIAKSLACRLFMVVMQRQTLMPVQ
jgi:hypothetical protein